MAISVALCTYNGTRHLPEQLASIAGQTLPPDEVVVCDDASTDGTARVIEEFAAGAPFPVRLHVNAHNVGSTRNFEQAVGLCRGDVIALSDQDDVWHPEKLARLNAALEAHPEAGLVFSDAEIVDENGRPMHLRLMQCAHLTRKERKLFDGGEYYELLRVRNVVTGATMAFRSRYRDLVLPMPGDMALIHDGWIALAIAAVADLVFVPETLIDYRQHPGQQIGAALEVKDVRGQVLPQGHYLSHIQQLEVLHARLTDRQRTYPHPLLASRLRTLEAQVRHIRTRTEMMRSGRRHIPTVLRELITGRYHRHSNGFYSVVRDLLY